MDTHNHTEDKSEWMSISNLMLGLMIIFLLIAIIMIYGIKAPLIVEKSCPKCEKNQAGIEEEIHEQLVKEFKEDYHAKRLIKIEHLTISFIQVDNITTKPPTATFDTKGFMFDSQSSTIEEPYRTILDDFCPRYFGFIENISNLYSDEVRIEVHIEGHASSKYDGYGEIRAYMANMTLSQRRANSVLRYCLNTIKEKDQEFIIKNFIASGFSSTQVMQDDDTKQEDSPRSRRVEFTIKTKPKPPKSS